MEETTQTFWPTPCKWSRASFCLLMEYLYLVFCDCLVIVLCLSSLWAAAFFCDTLLRRANRNSCCMVSIMLSPVAPTAGNTSAFALVTLHRAGGRTLVLSHSEPGCLRTESSALKGKLLHLSVSEETGPGEGEGCTEELTAKEQIGERQVPYDFHYVWNLMNKGN